MAEAPKRTMKERLSAHFAQYGKIAIYTYLTLSLAAIVGFSIAIGIGVGASSTGGVLGAIGSGWVAAKATMPLRILATLGLTPLVATLLRRRHVRSSPTTERTEPVESAEDRSTR